MGKEGGGGGGGVIASVHQEIRLLAESSRRDTENRYNFTSLPPSPNVLRPQFTAAPRAPRRAVVL